MKVNRYKVKKIFQDARTNEIYSAGVLISLDEKRAEEIFENLGTGFIELIPDEPGQIDDFVQVAVDNATAPLMEEIERLKLELSASKAKAVNEETEAEPSSDEFPKNISRGKYELSNGGTFEGNKTEAIKAEKALEK